MRDTVYIRSPLSISTTYLTYLLFAAELLLQASKQAGRQASEEEPSQHFLLLTTYLIN